MLLDSKQFRALATEYSIAESGGIAVDVETTGLSVHHGAKAFLLGVSGSLGEHSVWLFDNADIQSDLRLLFGNKYLRYAGHNLKFEMSFLRHQFGVEIKGATWDTMIMERVRYNNHRSYSLQACAEREGWSKHPPMLAWLKDNDHAYVKAPTELIVPYVEQDAKLSRLLMELQIEQFKSWDTATKVPVKSVVKLELATTPVLFEMESCGMRVDLDYCSEAIEYELGRKAQAMAEFQALTGLSLVDSRKCLSPIFAGLGLAFGRTDKGNASFTYDHLLPNKDHPVVKALLTYRDAVKRASTYWENFLALTAPDGHIHPSIFQTGAATSRMSVRDPACQTWADDGDDIKYPIRRAFPAEPGCKIVSMDWKGVELRLMADEAGETGMIEAFKQGRDFHQEVADDAGVGRGPAKNGRFCRLYGGGIPRLAKTLGVPLATAKCIAQALDKQAPKIAAYTQDLIDYAERTGTGYNWLGRRFFFDRGYAYKHPNYRIQGGCGDILKVAIVDIAAFFKRSGVNPLTRMIMLVHDEVIFNWHPDDFHLIPQVEKLMVGAYRSKRELDLEVTISWGPNFFDLKPFTGV